VGQSDGREQGGICGLAGSWVDDVPIVPAPLLEEFAPNGRDGEGFIAQRDDREKRADRFLFLSSRTAFQAVPAGILPAEATGAGSPGDRLEACPALVRALDGDLPRAGFRRVTDRIDRTGATVDQCAGDAGFAKQLRGNSHSVTFAYGTEVEHHALAGKADSGPAGVEFDEAHAGFFAGFGEGFGRGHLPSAVHESPATHKWSDGDVERAARFRAQACSLFQEPERVRRNAHGLARGAGVDMGDFARGPVKAETSLDAFDFVERLLARSAERDRVVPVQRDLETCRHRLAGEGEGLAEVRHPIEATCESEVQSGTRTPFPAGDDRRALTRVPANKAAPFRPAE